MNAGTHNNLNQLKTLSATGPIRFAGSLNEAGTVTVNGQPVAVAGDNSFAGDVALPPGSNSVAVVAKDPLNNTTTNNYTVAVASGTARTLTYDLVGNMTDNGAGQTYEWDAVNRLTKITYTGGARTEFTYDALDRRVKIVEKNSSGSTTSEKRFVWDGMAIVEERDGSNVLTKRFYGQGVMVGSNEFYYTRDHLGSIRELSDDTGAIEARYDYDPYGRITKVSGSGDADFRYTGHYYHTASGLNLAPYRAYDAALGAWLARDPIGEQGGINLYGYVNNSPTGAIDTSGWAPQKTIRVIGTPDFNSDGMRIVNGINARSKWVRAEYKEVKTIDQLRAALKGADAYSVQLHQVHNDVGTDTDRWKGYFFVGWKVEGAGDYSLSNTHVVSLEDLLGMPEKDSLFDYMTCGKGREGQPFKKEHESRGYKDWKRITDSLLLRLWTK